MPSSAYNQIYKNNENVSGEKRSESGQSVDVPSSNGKLEVFKELKIWPSHWFHYLLQRVHYMWTVTYKIKPQSGNIPKRRLDASSWAFLASYGSHFGLLFFIYFLILFEIELFSFSPVVRLLWKCIHLQMCIINFTRCISRLLIFFNQLNSVSFFIFRFSFPVWVRLWSRLNSSGEGH